MDSFVYSEHDTQAEQLVESLNLLLDNVEIPLQIDTLYDLTPSLLLMILENCLKSRLPLPDKLRRLQTPESKVEVIKMFLGVLGNDVLQVDLSSMDPRRVSEGEWEELVYVGELLITASKNLGLLGEDQIVDADSQVSYSLDDVDNSTYSNLSALKIDTRDNSRSTRSQASLTSPTKHTLANRSTLTPRSPNQTMKPTSSRLPERQSTPPPTPLVVSPRAAKRNQLSNYDYSAQSVCTCAHQEDLTSSTMHCHCDLHSGIDGASASSFDDTCDQTNETITDIWGNSGNLRQERDFGSRIANKKLSWNTGTSQSRPPRISDEFLRLRSGSSLEH
ncbi:hypothetical protein PIIN_07696 [Serendipita indica DSM 11827]|uniref:DUF5745 domain-containing protein n=1 Tax=Serendipita indica (strain DSM 11827) TaxID=1109443 RepID=G4TQZ8_SERID|nr:hypothetical protein PIIN_07696 [Serendipita indica DSM 11827]